MAHPFPGHLRRLDQVSPHLQKQLAPTHSGTQPLMDFSTGAPVEIHCPKRGHHQAGIGGRRCLTAKVPAKTLPDMLVAWSADAARRGFGRFSDRCEAAYRTLPPPPR
jgi:hypothetical protein